jgi:sarcosine oxidase subunit beta
LSERAEVVVIGGGVIGVATAHALAERNVTDVVVLEQEHLAFGSSGASAAVIETQYLDPNMIAITTYGHRLCSMLEEKYDLPFLHHGYLRLARLERDLDRYEESVRAQAEMGVVGPRVVSRSEITELVPGLRTDDLVGALWGPDDGFIDAPAYCSILFGIAKDMGVRLRRGKVEAIELDRGRVARVALSSGEVLECDVVVNAAGAWAAAIGRLVGLEVPVAGYRRQILTLEPIKPFSRPVPFVIDYVPGDEQPGLYFRDDGSHRLLAGMHEEGFLPHEVPEDPATFSRTIDVEYASQLWEMLAERLPWTADLRQSGGWAGLYPLTPDTRFIIGEAPTVPGFYNAAGGGGVGVQCSAGIGAIVADLITKGRTELVNSVEEYKISRFSA